MPKSIATVCILICLLAACDTGSQRRLDRETFERETRLREPRRIKEAEIIAGGMAQGQQIVSQLQAGSQPDTTSCCPVVPAALLDSLENQYQARINCYSILKEKPTAADPLEQEIWEAYRYNQEQQLPLAKNLQAQGKQYFIYTAPATNGGNIKNPCAIWSIRLSRKQIVLSL